MNAGTRVDHNQFCVNEGWEKVRGARGGEVRHHVTYELPLPDGRILRTRISRPVKKETYGPDLWKRILSSDQLDVSEGEFWSCVRDKVLPDRGGAASETPQGALPAQLVYQLIHQAGVPEGEVAEMSVEDATARMVAYWSSPKP